MSTEETREMLAIEQKEIRGINLKTILVILGSTITIVASILGSYYKLKDDFSSVRSDIKEIRQMKDTDKLIFDMKIQMLQSDVSEQKAKVSRMEQRVDGLESKTVKN